jgi:hypothetical protein
MKTKDKDKMSGSANRRFCGLRLFHDRCGRPRTANTAVRATLKSGEQSENVYENKGRGQEVEKWKPTGSPIFRATSRPSAGRCSTSRRPNFPPTSAATLARRACLHFATTTARPLLTKKGSRPGDSPPREEGPGVVSARPLTMAR